ncbi:hypothetical protein ACFQT0_12730 [Hymenobacter humi]|uniref:DUF3106 domain-containing protein n=1 Tax=Hymenobacter humi TaxID=1411620 RepID=A0ABW2U3V6_9BACT
MSDSVSDFYHQKTDEQLQFIVQQPALYHPSLVEASQRELRRRGVAVAAPVPAPAEAAPPPRAWGKAVGLSLGMVVLVSGIYWLQQHSDAQKAEVQARNEARRRHQGPPQLTEVPTNAIPNFDGAVASAVAQQPSRVPAAEKTDAQHLRQYRELLKRFWTAETQTEHLTSQAQAGKAGPMFVDQALLVRQTWRGWNQAAVYSYKFGPVMKEHFERMANAASSQQHILDQLPAKLANRQFINDKELNARQADVQDWLAALVPRSPVTGRPYKATLLKARL